MPEIPKVDKLSRIEIEILNNFREIKFARIIEKFVIREIKYARKINTLMSAKINPL